MSTDKEPTSLFTAAETKFVLAVFKNMEGGIKFNKEAVAQELGMKDAGSVGARWNTIYRTKISGGAATSPPVSAKTNKKTKSGEVGEEPQTSTGKKRGRNPKAAGDQDNTPTKPSKQARADSAAAEEGDSDESGGRVKLENQE